MENDLIFGNIRISFLGEEILRIERKYRGAFCNENTFFIPDRGQFVLNGVAYSFNEGVLCFGDYELYLPKGNTLGGLRLEKNGKPVYRYQRISNSGELPPPQKTPEVFPIADTPRIFLPEGGYSVMRKGEYRIQENAEDVYLLFAKGDAKRLRRLYVELTGRCELVRLSTLGGWNSKYYAYSEETAKKLICDYEHYGVPLDNMVIDTDWRLSEKGWGYDVNKKLFPDMRRFLDFAHSRGVEIMFNDHPEPVHGSSVFEPCEIAYREKNLQALMELGLDSWWYDRNWHTHLISPTEHVQWESFGLYLYHDVTKNFYRNHADGGKIYRRPVIMGNVVDIANGDYLAITDSASHRYGIQWTGDIASMSCTLGQEIENLIRCSENCIAYMNSDCGGHTGNPDKEQFIRWMQYGTLSPVFRPHCTNTVLRHREPWLYDDETLDIVREYNLMRYRLLPCLYTLAYEAYATGIAMMRSLALEYPDDGRAARNDEYLFGKNLLVAPVCGAVPQPLTEKNYVAPVEVTFYKGIELKGEPVASVRWKKLFMPLRHESPAEGVPVYNFSARVKTKIAVKKPVRLYVKNDDGATVYLDGECVLDDKNTHSAVLTPVAELQPNRVYCVEIDYFQADGEAFLGLYQTELSAGNEKQIYLPAGRWMDLFDGQVYNGRQTVNKRYSLRSMPLFVRLGALIPLAEGAQTTKAQDWSRLVYDFYPDKASSDEGYLYEDDGETTAYLYGAFRKSRYIAEYLAEENAFMVRLRAAEGEFSGTRATARREYTIKYHLLKGVERVKHVSVNGKDMPFNIYEKSDVFPLNTEHAAPDGAVLTVNFVADTAEDTQIKFFLE